MTDLLGILKGKKCLSHWLENGTSGHFPGDPMIKTSPSIAGGVGLIPGRGAKIPHESWPRNKNIKQKSCCNKFSKDFKNGPHQKNL